jgi:hypothetical protein
MSELIDLVSLPAGSVGHDEEFRERANHQYLLGPDDFNGQWDPVNDCPGRGPWKREVWTPPPGPLVCPVCLLCGKHFFSLADLRNHRQRTGHLGKQPLPQVLSETDPGDDSATTTPIILSPYYGRQQDHPDRCADGVDFMKELLDGIMGACGKPKQKPAKVFEPSPCMVCLQRFDSKEEFYSHLNAEGHNRSPTFVQKRRADMDLDAGGARKRVRV